ncbi:hypothetical protein FISHEDRAFT_77735 [Fistulina hepatica ATCC 64428]|nr:hypothetical protein FISHEDRAFT_77735 [Fistulina hepatica ATCC 64428]
MLLDLMLMKRGVYRHLLYNRGASPRLSVRDPTSTGQPVQGKRDKRVSKSIWVQVLSLGGPLILSDAISQWISFHGSEADANISSFVLTFLICAAETAAFHVGVIFACYVTVVGVNWRWCRLRVSDPLGAKVDQSAIRKEFRPSLIPLSLFYSTITKSFLLILLTIWHPSALSLSFMGKHVVSNRFLSPMSYALSRLDLFDDDKVDRQWLVRNGLGGLSAGFGLQGGQPLFLSDI